ncbi:MAG TPA: terminase family protein [Croceibacterium sp.]|nr:terminase family protein [Croceibacterium sp.]
MPGDSRLEFLLSLDPIERRALLHAMDEEQRRAIRTHWHLWAHEGQLPPPGEWLGWLIMAGRGFGKTRAGSEWVRAVAAGNGTARIALVAASLGEARSVMVEGPAGLLSIAPEGARPRFKPSTRELQWPNGATATLYSAAEPESLRGPQHSHAWCDELGKWNQTGGRAEAAWDNLILGLRLGETPRLVVTTTPRAVPLVRRLAASADFVVSRGATEANADNLPPGFLHSIRAQFGQSLLGRQEIDGELIEDVAGALWNRELLERCREGETPTCPTRVVIGVDPPASSEGDACGIVVCALHQDGIARVMVDCSVRRPTPERWARAVAEAARAWDADRVIAEANNGGSMVRSVLHAAEVTLPVRLVHASRGKAARAEPVAALYEAGRVRHAGQFPLLEDEMCGILAAGEYQGPGRSPDRADALVWALSELMLGRHGMARVRVI